MTSSQTACKTEDDLKYLFTQCEDIACRSVAPLQDTPANRITYSSNVTVPKGYDAYMSGNRTEEWHNDTHSSFMINNTIKMPSYLIALAVGGIGKHSIDHRAGVITEWCKMDATVWELKDLGMFLDYAEDYLTPYIWGIYDILILPPSFPMGGMENPLLTFASPTIITGDRSQVDVAIHEIAHSWTGNQVTCVNWSNMWLNEGFTVFEERKVSARIHGDDFSKVNAYIGNLSATNDMISFGLNNNYSSLYPQPEHNLPDNSFSTIPYEKGFQLLYFIESLIGVDYMQELLRNHINNNSLKSINYTDFVGEFDAIVEKYFPVPITIKSQMNWTEWVHTPGPARYQDLTTPELLESQKLAQEYISGGGQSSPQGFNDYNHWTSNLKVIFLSELVTNTDQVTKEIMQRIDDDLSITGSLDPEVKNTWFPLGIMKDFTIVIDKAHTFISSMGRAKYLTPIYKAMMAAGHQ